MPENTADFDIPKPLDADKPPSLENSVGSAFDRIDELFGAIDLSQLAVPGGSDGKLVIVKDGAAAYKAMSGDGTIDEDGVFQLGSKVVGTNELGDKAVTGAKVDDETIALAKLVKALGLTEGYFADGAVTGSKVAKVAREALGLDGGGEVRRGKAIIATEQSRSNAAYGTLTTPDQVSVVLPTDGLINIAYSAMVKASMATTINMALFIGADQLKFDNNEAAPVVQQAQFGGTGWRHARTVANGIEAGAEGYAGDVTTGQVITPVTVFAAAGTYAVSVQWKGNGNMTAKNRSLRVWTTGF